MYSSLNHICIITQTIKPVRLLFNFTIVNYGTLNGVWVTYCYYTFLFFFLFLLNLVLIDIIRFIRCLSFFIFFLVSRYIFLCFFIWFANFFSLFFVKPPYIFLSVYFLSFFFCITYLRFFTVV